jgi:hypothetical protein
VDVVDLLRSCRGFICLGDRGGVVVHGPDPPGPGSENSSTIQEDGIGCSVAVRSPGEQGRSSQPGRASCGGVHSLPCPAARAGKRDKTEPFIL